MQKNRLLTQVAAVVWLMSLLMDSVLFALSKLIYDNDHLAAAAMLALLVSLVLFSLCQFFAGPSWSKKVLAVMKYLLVFFVAGFLGSAIAGPNSVNGIWMMGTSILLVVPCLVSIFALGKVDEIFTKLEEEQTEVVDEAQTDVVADLPVGAEHA